MIIIKQLQQKNKCIKTGKVLRYLGSCLFSNIQDTIFIQVAELALRRTNAIGFVCLQKNQLRQKQARIMNLITKICDKKTTNTFNFCLNGHSYTNSQK